MRHGLVLLLVGVLVTACAEDGPAPAPERAAHWKQQGDEAFAARKWDRAITAYQALFSLVDPVPERARVRSVLAFRIGRAHAALARHETSEFRIESLARHGRIWLREALALHPNLYQVWFERAQLLELDSPHPGRDAALVAAYRAYLAGAANVSPDEQPRVDLARTRLRELDA